MLLAAFRPDEVALGRAGQRHPLEAVRNELKREFGEPALDLAADPGRAFVDALLDSEPNDLPNDFRAALARRTEGHPLFTVEMLRGLAERRDLRRDEHGRWRPDPQLDWEPLPARVEAIIAERIEGLPQEWQALLAAASVEGEAFTAEVVAGVLGQPEDAVAACLSGPLRRQRLVISESLRRLGSQRLSSYRFGHSLFQRYLYHGLDPVERARWHEAIGTRLADLHGEDAAEIAVQLAWHFEAAGMAARAADYLLEAGSRALRLAAYREAVSAFSRGLAVLATLPETPERTQRELDLRLALSGALIPLHHMADPIHMHTVAQALPLSRQGRGRQMLYALLVEASACRERCDSGRAIELGEQMLAMAEANNDRQGMMLAQYILGTARVLLGDTTQARTSLETGLSLYADAEDDRLIAFTGPDVKASMLAPLALLLWVLGYPDQAAARDREMLARSQQLAQPVTLIFALCLSIVIALYARNDQAAPPKIETLQRVVAEYGLELLRPWADVYDGWLLIQQDRVLEGIARMRESIATIGQGWGGSTLGMVLAGTCLQRGLYDEGLSAVDEALARVTQQSDGLTFEPEMLRLRGALTLGQAGPGSAEAAEESFLKAIEVARGRQSRSWELRAAMDLARLWRRLGRVADAQSRLAGIYGWFTEGYDTPDLREARALLEELKDPA